MKTLDDDLLVKVIIGESTGEETRQVDAWLAAGAGNRKYFADLKAIWDSSALLRVDEEVDVNKAWSRFRARTSPAVAFKPQKRQWWMAAAAAVLLAAGVWIFSLSKPGSPAITLTTENFIKTDTLPDGSTVTLNKNSVLSYSSGRTKQREVTLLGEAFFDVRPDPSRPFVISARGNPGYGPGHLV
ncbi:MAG: FecR domain-containing protein [Leadbetterella sp.]|nr:FecR domain-containing protein [Leadbetterella sp.]